VVSVSPHLPESIAYSRGESACQPGRCTVPTAWEREQARALRERHLAEREAETSRLNKLLDRRLAELDSLLAVGISRNIALDHNARKLPFPVFDAGEFDIPYEEPTLEDFFPPEPGAFARMLPGWRGRYEAQRMGAEEEFNAAHAEWRHVEKERKRQARQLAERDTRHQQTVSGVQEQHLRMDELAADARTGKQ
jgi:hypothetical protein